MIGVRITRVLLLLKYEALLNLFHKQPGNEVFGVLRNFIEGVIIKVHLSSSDVGESFCVIVTHKWRESRQPDGTTMARYRNIEYVKITEYFKVEYYQSI